MRRIAYSIAVREALTEEMEREPSVFLMGEDLAEYGGCFGITRGMLKKFGAERIRDTPISENTFVGMAVGAALMGMRPVVELMFMDFITLAMDQLVNHAAKFHYMYAGQVQVPMVVRLASGAGRGYGATHSQTLDAWLLNVPGLKVIAPAFPQDAKYLLKAAIRDNNPVIFNENKVLYSYADYVDDNIDEIPIGKAKLVRQGSDMTLIAYSRMVHEAIKAAEELAEQGIQAAVFDLRTLYPLDMDTLIASVKKTGCAVCIEEGVSRWGVCAEIVARLQEHCFSTLKAPIGRVGMADIPIPCSFQLEQSILPDAKAILQTALKVLNYSK